MSNPKPAHPIKDADGHAGSDSPNADWYDDDWRSSRWRSTVRRKLLTWFDKNARELPWRSDPTPYRVWVSEIMLQQTQVATVLPYFDRFLKAFPNVNSLAKAREEKLMKLWEGLGYYRRARSLHAAAKQIVKEHDGQFPSTFDEVINLPGIGRYTAGAILSISGDQKLPILEGNTQRVFARWIGMQKPVTDRDANRLLWEVAEAMLPATGSKAGTFNQAAMEIGALVCTPKNPSCNRCPVRPQCVAFQQGIEQQIPGKVKKIEYESTTEFAFVIEAPLATSDDTKNGSSRYLMRPLPDGVRWAGLWDFPRTIGGSIKRVTTAAKEVSRSLDTKVTTGDQLTKIRHAVTKYRIELHVHQATIDVRQQKEDVDQSIPEPWKFVTIAEMEQLPLSVTGRKIANLLKDAPPK